MRRGAVIAMPIFKKAGPYKDGQNNRNYVLPGQQVYEFEARGRRKKRKNRVKVQARLL